MDEGVAVVANEGEAAGAVGAAVQWQLHRLARRPESPDQSGSGEKLLQLKDAQVKVIYNRKTHRVAIGSVRNDSEPNRQQPSLTPNSDVCICRNVTLPSPEVTVSMLSDAV